MSCCCFLCFIASLVCTVQVLLRLDLRLRLVGPMVTLFLVRQMFFPGTILLSRRPGTVFPPFFFCAADEQPGVLMLA